MQRLLRALYQTVGWRLAAAVALLIAISLSEGVGLVLLVPLLQLAGLDASQGSIGMLARALTGILSATGLRPSLALVLGLYVAIVAMRALLGRQQAIFNHRLEESFSRTLRQQLYRAITASSWLYFMTEKASTFSHGLTSELNRVRSATRSALTLAVSVILALVYVGLALYLSAPITLLAFASGLSLTLLLRPTMLAARRKGQAISNANRSLYAAIGEHLAGMKVARSHGIEDAHRRTFDRLTEEVEGAYIEAVRNQVDVQAWFQIGSIVALSVMVMVALEVLSLPAATVVLLLFLFSRLMPMFAAIQNRYQSFAAALPAFDEVATLLERCRAEAEPDTTLERPLELRRAIELEGVEFNYPGSTTAVLKGIDLTFEAGRTTAVVGSSGAGKSTISDLLVGLLAPDRGSVLIDGTPLRPEHLRSWRRRLGYVAQETFLFHDTVRANLLATRPEASDSELYEALADAFADGFVRSLPEGLDTVVGDRGIRLSGGERQRLALARALLRKPTLLILDEATSALDPESEGHIQRAIERLRGKMTIIVIAHRLSTIRDADLIYVVEDGRLRESGTWTALLATSGRFRALYDAQEVKIDSSRS